MDKIQPAQDTVKMVKFSEHGNEPPDFIKTRNVLTS